MIKRKIYEIIIMAKIVLISCVSKKKETRGVPIEAKDLYVSSLFKKALKYAEMLEPDRVYILSAEYHLLELDDKVEKYDKTLNNMSADECKQWGLVALDKLKSKGNDLEQDEFILLAGDKYCKYILGEHGIKRGNQVYKENGLKGIGHILHFLSQAISKH